MLGKKADLQNTVQQSSREGNAEISLGGVSVIKA